jgi:hypothetical protein
MTARDEVFEVAIQRRGGGGGGTLMYREKPLRRLWRQKEIEVEMYYQITTRLIRFLLSDEALNGPLF